MSRSGSRPSPDEERRPQTIATEVAFGESVRWHGDRVWFCDWISREVISVSRDGGDRQVHATTEGAPICIDWRTDGTLLIVDGGNQQLLEHDDSDGLNLVADLSGVSDRTWNEIAAHPSGRIYVNGLGYDMMSGEPPRPGQIAVVDLNGTVIEVADGLQFPNGMAITPDGTTLIVAESYAGTLTAFTITQAGALEDRRIFAAIDGSAPDGICLAEDGSVWYADVPNQHCQRVAEGGVVLETVALDRGCFSCALSADGALFVAAAVFDEQTYATSEGVILAVDVTDMHH